MEDAAKMTRTLLGAVRACGVRAIISRGWSNLGAEEAQDPDVFFLGDCPHGWSISLAATPSSISLTSL